MEPPIEQLNLKEREDEKEEEEEETRWELPGEIIKYYLASTLLYRI